MCFKHELHKNVDTVGRIFDRAYLQALKLVYKNSVVSFLQKENYLIFNHSLFDIDIFPSTIQHIYLWGIREIFDQYNLVFKLNYDIGYKFPEGIRKIFENNFFVNSPKNRDRIDSIVYQHLIKTVKYRSSQPKFVYAHF